MSKKYFDPSSWDIINPQLSIQLLDQKIKGNLDIRQTLLEISLHPHCLIVETEN